MGNGITTGSQDILAAMRLWLVRGPNAAGERAGAVAGNVDKFLILGELIERGQEPFRLGKQPIVVVCIDLNQHVIHTEMVVTHGPLKVGEVGFLSRETFEDIEQLVRGAVESVVKRRLVRLAAL